MSATAAGWLQVAALVAVHKPLGDWMARAFTTAPTPQPPKWPFWWLRGGGGHWRVERLVYRAVGVDADAEQRWPVYLRSVLAFCLDLAVPGVPAAGHPVLAATHVRPDGR